MRNLDKFNNIMDTNAQLTPSRIYVVAGNNSEYLELVKMKPAEDRHRYVFVNNLDKIRGLSKIEGVYYGTYASRKDIEEIQVMIKAIKKFSS